MRSINYLLALSILLIIGCSNYTQNEYSTFSLLYTSNDGFGPQQTNISIAEDGSFTYTRQAGTLNKKINGTLPPSSMEELRAVLAENNFFGLPEDLSNTQPCFDAPTVNLKVTIPEHSRSVGGYCVFDRRFSNIESKVYALIQQVQDIYS